MEFIFIALGLLATGAIGWVCGRAGEEKRAQDRIMKYKQAMVLACGDPRVMQALSEQIKEVFQSEFFVTIVEGIAQNPFPPRSRVNQGEQQCQPTSPRSSSSTPTDTW